MGAKRLHNRLRVYRAEHRLSQQDLADAIGVSRKTISTIEVGRFLPSTVVALKLALYFEAPVEALFSLPEREQPAATAPSTRGRRAEPDSGSGGSEDAGDGLVEHLVEFGV